MGPTPAARRMGCGRCSFFAARHSVARCNPYACRRAPSPSACPPRRPQCPWVGQTRRRGPAGAVGVNPCAGARLTRHWAPRIRCSLLMPSRMRNGRTPGCRRNTPAAVCHRSRACKRVEVQRRAALRVFKTTPLHGLCSGTGGASQASQHRGRHAPPRDRPTRGICHAAPHKLVAGRRICHPGSCLGSGRSRPGSKVRGEELESQVRVLPRAGWQG